MEDDYSLATPSDHGPVSPRPNIDIDKSVISGRPSPIRTLHLRPVSPGFPTAPLLLGNSYAPSNGISGPRTAVSRDASFEAIGSSSAADPEAILPGTFIAFSLDTEAIAAQYDDDTPERAAALALPSERYVGLVNQTFVHVTDKSTVQDLFVNLVGTTLPPCPDSCSVNAIPISPCEEVDGMRPPLRLSHELFPWQDCMVWTALGVRLRVESVDDSVLRFELLSDERGRFDDESFADCRQVWNAMPHLGEDADPVWKLVQALWMHDAQMVPAIVWRDVRAADAECRQDPTTWSQTMDALVELYQKYPGAPQSPTEE
ncbi:hypothetical protein CERSUDRAFT_122287 [Gelatoporia subvermispora B]|uniref:Uncharacterized protein n=1 Tax=Ceriporiopsis subvermispora (strain B) TaxID=914234 RepID=M2RP59_CERS8|nr:hypothetical protein CERSUDRAFT_122287 [Gelatoporia subvermispora B]